jgi:hypothetical protein
VYPKVCGVTASSSNSGAKMRGLTCLSPSGTKRCEYSVTLETVACLVCLTELLGALHVSFGASAPKTAGC